MAIALRQLSQEDPTLEVSSEVTTGQTVIRGMGELHLELILDRLQRQFNVRLTIVGKPQVLYRTALKEVGRETKTVRLEPVMTLEIFLLGDHLASVIAEDLLARRGRIEAIREHGNDRIIQATVPLAEILGYASQLRHATKGRSSYEMRFARYEEIPSGK